MSFFNGRITRRAKLRGEATQKPQELQATVTPITGPRGAFTPVHVIAGTLRRAGKYLACAVRPLSALYRFLAAHGVIRSAKEARPTTAPATELEVANAIHAAQTAPLAAQPAKDMQADKRERLTVYARLVAYRRAGCKYVKQLFMGRKAAAIAAPGAPARYRKQQPVELTAEAEAAPGAILESRGNQIAHSYEAAGASAPAQVVPAIENTFTAKHKAQAAKASAVGVNIRRALQVTHSAKLATWFLPEQDGDTLRFYQVFSGVQSGNVLEIDLEAESAYWANATNKGGVLGLVFTESVTRTGNTLEVS